MEVPIDPTWAHMQRTLVYPLSNTPELSPAAQTTASSVIAALGKALAADQAAAVATGTSFDQLTWAPSEETVATIHETHRPYVRYLRGIAGLQEIYEEISSGKRQFDPPLPQEQIKGLRVSSERLSSVAPFSEERGPYFVIAGESNKTLSIILHTEGLKLREDPEDPHRILIIASDFATQDKLAGFDRKSGFGQYAPHLDVGIINHKIPESDRQVVIITRNSARRNLLRDPAALDRYDFIISEEIQILLGKQTSSAFAAVRQPIIGFTRSPKFEGQLTQAEAASGLGISVPRLLTALAAISTRGVVPTLISEPTMARLEKHLDEHGVPINPS